jgi:putative ABC transport system permease protein
VAVLGSTLAEELFGDMPPVGQLVTVGNTKLTVVGVFEEKGLVGSTDFDSRIYLPITVVFQKFTPSQFARIRGDRVRVIYVEVDAEVPLEDIILQTELLLAKRHDVSLEEPDFVIQTQQDIIQTQEATTAAFRDLLTWVAAVSLLVGGIGIMNIMLASVTERTREIGIRRAIGAKRRQIIVQFLIETVVLSTIGGILGIGIGVLIPLIITYFSGMPTVITMASILLPLFISASIGVIFGLYPAARAANVDPIVALRHE